jgi:rare lipoprotein A (peptidoglycan hydrolase)
LPKEEPLRRRKISRAALMAGALSMSAAAPAAAQPDVTSKRLDIRAGQRAMVAGAATPGQTVALEIRRRGHWRTVARDRATDGRFRLRARVRRTMSAPIRLDDGTQTHRVGRLNVYRPAYASWYGPGLYGNRLGCGGRLAPGRLGVAHKSLPCGSKVTLRHRGRSVRVRVIDRGPYVGGREYDLTEATARKLRFRGHGAILTTD